MFPTIRRVQNRLSEVLGCEPQRRRAIVDAMVHRGPKEITGFWLQLMISAGIATLGLVLGSTAVIIGAMLVAPLMGPILGLGMGLATGSPLLVLRSASRVGLSVVLVIGFAAAITRGLPFHELNPEIAARTTPTALDLATAVFCAMAGVYAAMRPGSDVATTAAGTSIGISLVPPLCVGGFGLGTDSGAIARGALLLFLTNFTAIVLVGTLAFAAVGFGQVDIAATEDSELDATPDAILAKPLVRRSTRWLRAVTGPGLRLMMPIGLLAALYSPLRAGLDQVAWQIAARNAVDRAIGALPQRVVQSRVRVERREIAIVIFLLGGPSDAKAARERLLTSIASEAGVQPRVDVHAVADAAEFEALERAVEKPATPPVIPVPEPLPPPPPTPAEHFAEVKEAVQDAVELRWPAGSGRPLHIDLAATDPPYQLKVVHLGTPLGADGTEILEQILSEDLGAEIALRDAPIPPGEVDLSTDAASRLLEVASAVEVSRSVDAISICVVEPEPEPRRRRSAEDEQAAQLVRSLLRGHPRVSFTTGTKRTLRFVAGGCVIP